VNAYFPPALVGPLAVEYRMCITVAEHSALHIRRIVRSLLAEWDMPGLSDDVTLAATELVANVVRHVPDRRCTFRLLRQTAGVRVEVTDGCPQLPAIPADFSVESEGGRGLALVEAVVDKWGVGPAAGGGKTVWFECRR
jgi:anti-sigma regulatory factor (Ser/Thr protein kinase)